MGIDDGSKSLEESITILKKAQKAGVTDIMLTPHYIKNSKFACNNEKKKELLEDLKEKMKKENIKIALYLGNEVYIDSDIISLINNNEIKTLNDSRYILVELPLTREENDAINIFKKLINKGYIVILAHPERYTYIQEDPSKIEDFLGIGVLMQGNFKSLLGKYGEDAEETLIELLKKDYIQFLASDIHHEKSEYYLAKAEKKLLKIVKSKDKVKDLLERNFDKVVNNIKLEKKI